MNELVTIVIPTYKRGSNFLLRSINSIINQSYQQWELIVVDDNRFEDQNFYEIEKFVQSYNDNRIKYISNNGNFGANHARNKGIVSSEGSYIAFLDDDDEWLSQKLEKQLKVFQARNSSLGMVYCGAESINENGETNLVNVKHKSGSLFEELLFGNFIGSTSFVMVKREVFDIVGLFSEDLPSNQDWELYIRVSKKFEIESTPEILVRYHIHSGERITSNVKKKLLGINYIFEKYQEYIENDNNLKATFFVKIGNMQLKNKKYSSFIFYSFKALCTSPRIFLNYTVWRLTNRGEWY